MSPMSPKSPNPQPPRNTPTGRKLETPPHPSAEEVSPCHRDTTWDQQKRLRREAEKPDSNSHAREATQGSRRRSMTTYTPALQCWQGVPRKTHLVRGLPRRPQRVDVNAQGRLLWGPGRRLFRRGCGDMQPWGEDWSPLQARRCARRQRRPPLRQSPQDGTCGVGRQVVSQCLGSDLTGCMRRCPGIL